MKLALAGCIALTCASALAQEAYVLDSTHTTPMFEIGHLGGMSKQRGFFTDTTGRIVLDRAARTGSIEVVIGVGSVVTASRVLTEVLKRDDYFNASQFPAMRYTASELVFEGDVPVAANGQLTLLGVTKPVTLKISDFRCAAHPYTRRAMCGAEATATIRRSEFGMNAGIPNAAGAEVRIVIPVEAVPGIAPMRSLVVALAIGSAAAIAAAVSVSPYRIEPTQSRCEFTIGANQVNGRFAQVEGRLVYDAGAHAGSIELDLMAASIVTGWEARDDYIRGASLFDAAQYPRVRFRSRHFEFNGDRLVRVDGELTLRGITRPASFAVPRIRCARREDNRDACMAEAQGVIRRREFGMDAWWPLVGDEVELHIYLTAVRG